ncbi:interleukin-17 receptor A-like [Syngnathoides biaculeatus]|uniref:interleukin-17 receptor A-like n=1 Tax=Syngnathoides biaculeatus TaxID=300417 RepID=UPI002ADD85E9|nr:interleukin-17 receptor A-like [Syngnathoides biaculeatus]
MSDNCTDERKVVPRQSAPTAPEWGPYSVGIGQDNHVPVPVMNVTWTLRSDGNVLKLQGSQFRIVDKHLNRSLCVQFTYSINQQLNPNFTKWTFSMSGLVVEGGRTYTLSAFHLPRPDLGDYTVTKQVTIPGEVSNLFYSHVVSDSETWKGVNSLGKNSPPDHNPSGVLFLDFCCHRRLSITTLKHKGSLEVGSQVHEVQCGFRPDCGTVDYLDTLGWVLEGAWEFAEPDCLFCGLGNGVRLRSSESPVGGCDDERIRKSQMCLENGSLWDPQVTTVLSVEKQMLSVVVGFEADKHSDLYQVSIESDGIHFSENVSKEYRRFLNVTFGLDVSQLLKCELTLMIKPFFTRCMNDGCRPEQMNINYCLYFQARTAGTKGAMGLLFVVVCFASLLWRASRKDQVTVSSPAADQQLQFFQVQERKKVLILYSLDHPLYKNIVLKLCAFLTAKCGTEVILDLLDSTRLGILGRIQWLDWQRERMESSSDKVLLLCSQGVRAKWRAMCGEKPVLLREDLRSPMGDMLTPALGLIVPHLVRRASFEKYVVAYFEDVCSPEDVPSPFNVTVRYKLMKQFEEVFFRILDAEKHGPGRVCHIEGVAEGEYHRCPWGRALREALEAFRAYQLKHPQWFEEELVEDLKVEQQVL